MRWVYILKCIDDYYYVGETKRLYRRFWEHQEGIGGINTSTYIPEGIVSIYKVSTLGNFFEYNNMVMNKNCNIYFNRCDKLLAEFNNTEDDEDDEYDNLFAENNIIECLMLNNKDNWQKIRGGKYTRFDIEYNLPINEYIKNLPLCNCGLPCDITPFNISNADFHGIQNRCKINKLCFHKCGLNNDCLTFSCFL
jgi:hypothetical protein